jgi:hypothetical protein
MKEAGKGSVQRKTNQSSYSDNWDKIFGEEKKKRDCSRALDELVRLSEELGLYSDRDKKD